MAFTPTNKRMCILSIKNRHFNLPIIHVHVPTYDSQEITKYRKNNSTVNGKELMIVPHPVILK